MRTDVAFIDFYTALLCFPSLCEWSSSTNWIDDNDDVVENEKDQTT